MADITLTRDIAVSPSTTEDEIFRKLADVIQSEMKVTCGSAVNGAARFNHSFFEIEANVRKDGDRAKIAFFGKHVKTGTWWLIVIGTIISSILTPLILLVMGPIGFLLGIGIVIYSWASFPKFMRASQQKTQTGLEAVLSRLEMTLR